MKKKGMWITESDLLPTGFSHYLRPVDESSGDSVPDCTNLPVLTMYVRDI